MNKNKFKLLTKKLKNYKPFSQKTSVILHLLEGHSITQVEAEAVYKIRRLAARVFELKQDGWPIKKEMKRDRMGQRYMRYFV